MSEHKNREAEFLAKVTTGTTHEIRNVLAIIKESAGLMEDMVAAAERGRTLQPDRLSRSIDRIAAQVERGAELMTALNRFAHGLDHAQEQIDLHREAEQVALMCGRKARRKNQEVEVKEDERGVSFAANRLRFEMALFTGVECCLEQLPEHGTVIMHSGRYGGAPALEFRCEFGEGGAAPPPEDASSWQLLLEVLDMLGATVETEGVHGHFRLRFL